MLGALDLMRVLQGHRYLLLSQAQCGLRITDYFENIQVSRKAFWGTPHLGSFSWAGSFYSTMSLGLLSSKTKSENNGCILILLCLFVWFDFWERAFPWSSDWPVTCEIFLSTFDSWKLGFWVHTVLSSSPVSCPCSSLTLGSLCKAHFFFLENTGSSLSPKC